MQAHAAIDELRTQLQREKKLSADLQAQNGELCGLTSKLRMDITSMESRQNAVISQEVTNLRREHETVVNDLNLQHNNALSEMTASHHRENQVATTEIEELNYQLEASQDMYNDLKAKVDGDNRRARAFGCTGRPY